MAHYRPGQVIRFTYRHFWPTDANSRDPSKELFILHPHWEGKVHGIDLKVLPAAKLEIFKVVMDPVYNKSKDEKGTGVQNQEFGAKGSGIGEDFRALQAREKMPPVDNIEYRIKVNNIKKEFAAERAKEMGFAFDDTRYEAENQRLLTELEHAKEIEADAENAADDDKTRNLPPIAQSILKRMKPGKLVNNPRIFYAMFIKPFLGGIDAYRTFFPARIENAVEVPRWEWTRVPGMGRHQQEQKQRRTPFSPPKKFYGQQEDGEKSEFNDFNFSGQRPTKIDSGGGGSGGGGMKPTPPGVVETMTGGKRGPVLRKFDKNNTEIIKKDRPK